MVSLDDCFQRLLDASNKAKFTTVFTGDNNDTIQYLFAVKKFTRINRIKDKGVEFARIFNTIPPQYQDRFIGTTKDDDVLTLEDLKKWILKTFPPTQDKHMFVKQLKLIRQRFNEDPQLVYQRFLSVLDQIQRSIKLINETRYVEIPEVSEETQVDALINIFCRQNNQLKPSFADANNGEINRLTRKFLYNKDPTSVGDWERAFADMRDNLIPHVGATLAENQYAVYTANPYDDDIYKLAQKSAKKPIKKPTKQPRAWWRFQGPWWRLQRQRPWWRFQRPWCRLQRQRPWRWF
eukprot:495445_1